MEKRLSKSIGIISGTILLSYLSIAAGGADFNDDGYDDLVIGVPAENDGLTSNSGVVHVIYGLDSSGLSGKDNQLWEQGESDLPDSSEANDNFGNAVAWGKLNNDTFDDLVIGVFGENVYAGAVIVIYGTSTGLDGGDSEQWSQDIGDMEDSSESYDYFGTSLAVCDFNGDGIDDLAIGIPGEELAGQGAQTGAVAVIYGDAGGLDDSDNQLFSGDANGDHFGSALAAGYFDDNEYCDLAVGVPNADDGANANVGEIKILMGTETGLTTSGSLVFNEDDLGGTSSSYEYFGERLIAADFDGDNYDDLASASTHGNVGGLTYAGHCYVIYSDSEGTGLSEDGAQEWNQYVSGIEGNPGAYKYWAGAIAAGDFNNNGYADLAIGATRETVEGEAHAGWVQILKGSSSGISTSGTEIWDQGTDADDVEDEAEDHDYFGNGLITGNYNGDSYEDLTIGVTGEDVTSETYGGAVNVIYGASGGLSATSTPDQFWHQDWYDASYFIPDACEDNDYFGQGIDAL